MNRLLRASDLESHVVVGSDGLRHEELASVVADVGSGPEIVHLTLIEFR